MTIIMMAALLIGAVAGRFILPSGIVSNLGNISSFALDLLIFFVGIDMGRNRDIFKSLRYMGLKILLVPVSTVIGSLIGGAVAAVIWNMPLNIGLAISAGFGWYSLCGIMLSGLAGIEVGTVSFLANVFRELIALMIIPLVAKRLNHITAIATAGAASMDTVLPIISGCAGKETAAVAFINGAVLSVLVPVIIPLLVG